MKAMLQFSCWDGELILKYQLILALAMSILIGALIVKYNLNPLIIRFKQ